MQFNNNHSKLLLKKIFAAGCILTLFFLAFELLYFPVIVAIFNNHMHSMNEPYILRDRDNVVVALDRLQITPELKSANSNYSFKIFGMGFSVPIIKSFRSDILRSALLPNMGGAPWWTSERLSDAPWVAYNAIGWIKPSHYNLSISYDAQSKITNLLMEKKSLFDGAEIFIFDASSLEVLTEIQLGSTRRGTLYEFSGLSEILMSTIYPALQRQNKTMTENFTSSVFSSFASMLSSLGFFENCVPNCAYDKKIIKMCECGNNLTYQGRGIKLTTDIKSIMLGLRNLIFKSSGKFSFLKQEETLIRDKRFISFELSGKDFSSNKSQFVIKRMGSDAKLFGLWLPTFFYVNDKIIGISIIIDGINKKLIDDGETNSYRDKLCEISESVKKIVLESVSEVIVYE